VFDAEFLLEGPARLKGKTPRAKEAPEGLSQSAGFAESPDPFLLGLLGEKPSLEAESFVGSLGVNECIRALGVGGSSTGKVPVVGEEMEMDIIDSLAMTLSSGGEDERGMCDTTAGNGCFIGLEGTSLLLEEAGCKVALLLLLLRYSWMRCWNELSSTE
jgi:hypothetical protein